MANAQYLQWHTHVRESDSVTLREKVTRRRTANSLRAAAPKAFRGTPSVAIL